MNLFVTAAVLALGVLVGQAASQEAGVRLDHLILAINDLDRGMDEFETRTGVRPVFGGVHPGRGTRNALVSLGDGVYLEILAPDPAQEQPAEPMPGLKNVASLTPTAWALATDDLGDVRRAAEAAGMGVSVVRGGARELPDGRHLEWATLGIVDPAHGWMPFFIQWRDLNVHPSRTSPQGCTLASVALQDPAAAPLQRALDAVGYQMTVTQASPAQMTVALDCPKGRVEFR